MNYSFKHMDFVQLQGFRLLDREDAAFELVVLVVLFVSEMLLVLVRGIIECIEFDVGI